MLKKIYLLILIIVIGLLSADPLFEVTNESGTSIFSVTPTGVEILGMKMEAEGDTIWISNTAGTPLMSLNGAGMIVSDSLGQQLMIAGSDSVRFYIKDPGNTIDESRGGFAVGSVGSRSQEDYLFVTSDSTRINVNVPDSLDGFSVANIHPTGSYKFMNITPINLFLGHEAGYSNDSGTGNLFFGKESGKSSVWGDRNSFFGDRSGMNSLGDNNTCLGYYSGHDIGTGYENTFVGYRSGTSSGSKNTCIGGYAGYADWGASENVYLGYKAGYGSGGASGNICIGYMAGSGQTISNKLYIANTNDSTPLIYGDFNNDLVKIYSNLNINNEYTFPNLDGSANQVMQTNGSGAVSWTSISQESTMASNGLNLETGTVKLGGTLTEATTISQTDYNLNYNLTGTGNFNVSDNGTLAFCVNNTGNVGIGTSTSNEKLHVYSTQGNGHIINEMENGPLTRWSLSGATPYLGSISNHGFSIVSGGGYSITADNTGNVGIGITTPGYKLTVNGEPAANGYTQFTNYSDMRLKENIQNTGSVLDKISKLRPVSFNYNQLTQYDDETRAKTFSGFIAQELIEVFPEMVGEIELSGETYLDANLSSLPVYLVKAIQELKEENETLKKQVKEIDVLKDEIENIKSMLERSLQD